ncbi:hypothetical protein ACFSCZ_00170 [Siminovitchia sediminis]|uniref:Uncharacterized protein n=1 Tax=Siminovitchia sediminis TaxID=1274353 RepID=A0ABW4KAE6_9BACI
MKIPKHYSEWVDCLDVVKEGTNDQAVIECMEKGSIEWSRGVAERITQRLYETFEHRIKRTSDLLQKDLNRCNGNETEMVKALLSARKRLALLKRLAQLEAFPENVRESLAASLEEYAKNTQESLEKSALSDRTGRLRMLIKNNAVTKYDEGGSPLEASAESQTAGIEKGSAISFRRRRNILL